MNRLRLPLLAAVCLIVPAAGAVWSAPVPGARSGLEQVPDTAPVVVHLRGIQGTRDRLVAMMQNALPDVLKKFQSEMDDFLENGKDGRKIRGLQKDGPIFLVVTDLPKSGQPLNGPPPFAVILAVKDYKEFRDNILTKEESKGISDKGDGIESAMMSGETTFFVDRKGYAVVTPNEDIAKSFAKDKKFTGLDSRMSKEQAAKLLSSDLGVFVNMQSVNKEYADDIKKAKEGIEQALALGAAAGDESQKKITEAFKKALDPTFQAIEDMHALLLTAEMRPGGLALHLQSEMKESSPTANLLQDSSPIDFKELERMPAGRMYYSALKTSSALYKALGSMMSGVPLGKGAEDSKEVAAALNELADAGPTVRMDGFSFPMNGLQVYHYDDPNKAVAAQVKLFKALMSSDPKNVGLKEKPKLTMDAAKIGDFKLHSIQLAWDFEKMAEPVAQKGDDAKKQYIEAMKGILGEKSTMWFGTDGKSLVLVNAPDSAAAKKLLDQYSQGTDKVGDNKAYLDVRKEMPRQTSFMGLIDSAHMFASILEIVKPMMPPGVSLPPGWPIMPAKDASAYVGMAVTLQPKRGSFDFFISAAAAREFYKSVVKPLVGE
jgi:hypothetical protein